MLDFGITGRLTEPKRLALLSLLVGASNGDIPVQVGALRDLGAFPGDVDVQHVIDVLGLDRPPIDPTALSYLLAVTGPAELPDGTQASAANVVALTESTTYETFATDDSGRRDYLLDEGRPAQE